MSRKKNKKRIKTENIKHMIATISTFIVLLVLVLSGAYLIFETELLKPTVNKVTASYISLNNNDITDILKINNLKKMSTNKGKSNNNPSYIDLNITGDKNMNYDIIIYPINNSINNKYINFSLNTNDGIIIKSLDKLENSTDGGKIIYSSKINNSNKYRLNMWISDDYKGTVKDNSFEVKIKSR